MTAHDDTAARVEEIRESRKDGYWGSPGDGYEALDAEQHVDYLLARIDKLQAVADAAQGLLFTTRAIVGTRQHEARERLLVALAALDTDSSAPVADTGE